ncbi:hypothetical protein AC629_10865 [Bradyrhizobium sp. NAS80.1]|uniref:hypothetical protein n=1 Tax=Bradyrhizobium sp. NAS80.1 TaxID=1680159 RepID=UPI00095BEC28|nr:hypothetical protein [Bradyrhizobium sp. NAS80.1]OKO88045.1 hypothetical protein AC629_10865 [Bradyrhizobium sp. NAS80.1]
MPDESEPRAIDGPLPAEYAEAFGLCIKLVSARIDDDPERMKAVNDSLMADLLGDAPLPVPVSSVDQSVVRLLHGLMELMQVPNRFDAMATMVRLYPWGGKISRAQHMENCYYLIVNETYILEERLKAFVNHLIACATSRSFQVDLSSVNRLVIKLHKGFFGKMVAARGIHVHQQSYVPREIKRIETLELMMMGPEPKAQEGPWKLLHRIAFREARKQWVQNAEDAAKAAKYIIGHLLVQTQLVWRTVLQEELDKLDSMGAGQTKASS